MEDDANAQREEQEKILNELNSTIKELEEMSRNL
jgi:hypothetical protein